MVKVKFLGYVVFLIEGSKKIFIDLFFSGNLKVVVKFEEVEVDFIFVIYVYGDYIGDVIEIVRRSGVKIVVMYDIVNYIF